MKQLFLLIALLAVVGCAIYAQSTGGRVGKFERFNPAQFSQSMEVVGIGSAATFSNLVLVTPVITYTNGSSPIFTNAFDSTQFSYDTVLHIKSAASTTNENLMTPTITTPSATGGTWVNGYWTNGTGSGLTLTNTAFKGTVTGITTNTFDANQFTLVNGTNVHFSSGAKATNISATGTTVLPAVGDKLSIKEGGGSYTSNAAMGANALSSGTMTITNTTVTANTRIFLSVQSKGSNPLGTPYVSAQVNATSFTVTSTANTDNAIIGWLLVEPAP